MIAVLAFVTYHTQTPLLIALTAATVILVAAATYIATTEASVTAIPLRLTWLRRLVSHDRH